MKRLDSIMELVSDDWRYLGEGKVHVICTHEEIAVAISEDASTFSEETIKSSFSVGCDLEQLRGVSRSNSHKKDTDNRHSSIIRENGIVRESSSDSNISNSRHGNLVRKNSFVRESSIGSNISSINGRTDNSRSVSPYFNRKKFLEDKSKFTSLKPPAPANGYANKVLRLTKKYRSEENILQDELYMKNVMQPWYSQYICQNKRFAEMTSVFLRG